MSPPKPVGSSDHPSARPALSRSTSRSWDGTELDEAPVLPDVAADDADEGWGDRHDGRRSDDWYRRERPPHHG